MVDVGVCFSLINGQESGRRLHAHEAWNMDLFFSEIQQLLRFGYTLTILDRKGEKIEI